MITITVIIEERERQLLVESRGKIEGEQTRKEAAMANEVKAAIDFAQREMAKRLGRDPQVIDLMNKG